MITQARKITASRPFRGVITATILLSGVLAGIETDPGMVAAHGGLLRAIDTIVLGIFVIEVMLKITAHGPQPWRYFKDGWNVFDFTIVALCLLPLDSQFAVVLRLARTLRVLRLVSALPKLQLLVGALFKSFGSMGYVGLLLGLLFYIYAITGVHLFGIHDKDHFGNLAKAFLTLFQTVTLDDWKQLFASAAGASPVAAAIYFVSFILLGTMIMLNLFIGIIMNSMSEMHAEIDAQDKVPQPVAEDDSALSDLAALEQQLSAFRSRIENLRKKITRTTP